MPRVGFKPQIPVIKQAKTFHALDGVTTVIGCLCIASRNSVKSRIDVHTSTLFLQQTAIIMLIKDSIHI
jgi:hypothetical protein